jgi:hypothetical protein
VKTALKKAAARRKKKKRKGGKKEEKEGKKKKKKKKGKHHFIKVCPGWGPNQGANPTTYEFTTITPALL